MQRKKEFINSITSVSKWWNWGGLCLWVSPLITPNLVFWTCLNRVITFLIIPSTSDCDLEITHYCLSVDKKVKRADLSDIIGERIHKTDSLNIITYDSHINCHRFQKLNTSRLKKQRYIRNIKLTTCQVILLYELGLKFFFLLSGKNKKL